MGGGEPFDQSHTGQGGKEASRGAAFSAKDAWGAGGRLRARGDGVAAPISETATRIVELPVTFPLEPDTSTAAGHCLLRPPALALLPSISPKIRRTEPDTRSSTIQTVSTNVRLPNG
jgi:hypothetical protein